ncbi:cobalamin-independent methionine synthase II family protein [Rhodoplanes sp. Z2-YC6860]|uniref:cobalamin-independent methionine synthase II family protein n=1 Tax=Rhodoplanes sp. Z2-YC6860 TaxID=674703 RepID=UPI00078B28C6|nr:cobalamin-independent methionine synthase II family protein [Rhodoplanes sp. Z2-YC6860]AMN42073.1 vitamin-B12 independent methionine synthase [Rhodoplanes sp. Z2-YC6860]
MRRSTDRILTTHAGSLPRPADLLQMVRAKARGEPVDEPKLASRIKEAVTEIVHQQVDAGLDVIDDGEFGKPSFVTYIRERLGGLEPHGHRPNAWLSSREAISFPDYYKQQESASPRAKQVQMACTSPLTYKGQAALKAELETLKSALKGVNAAEVFVPCISPANIEDWNENRYYASNDEYLLAIADAMNVEYKTIVDAGFLVQVDDPRLVSYYLMDPKMSVDDIRKWASKRVEALNHALRGIPTEKIRYHTCYSINMGPRIHDLEVKHIIDILMQIRAGAFSFEASNPRHEHEWAVWKEAKLPKDTVLIPGVITNSSVLVEHPELVAQRILRFAEFMGRENVIAGTDCGFASFAGSDEVHASIVWAKMDAMVQGAEIASKKLWGR